MEFSIENLKQKLCDREYKLTPQRRIIMEMFTNNQEKHLSAEDVYGMIKQNNPEIGLATVYRTLDLFAELDILQKIDFGDGRSRYEFYTDDVHHHHHLICLECGKVMEFADDLLESLESAIEEKIRFKIIDHQLKFYGYCEKCHK
ncbi:Fur family transcriptional regulator [Phosphitispora sp. TUW77]|uniref:Fur family transcriptional regulator n=1 Tax=Phosphitispora sp. TUW77 TaxID=3152361 RepID=UPI003AB469CE